MVTKCELDNLLQLQIRFLMNRDEAVELVRFAFHNANQGDLFIQKADASTIGGGVLLKVFRSSSVIPEQISLELAMGKNSARH